MIVTKAQTFTYSSGDATIQLVEPSTDAECDSVVRLWEGQPKTWWNFDERFDPGFGVRVYESFIQKEQRCWTSWKKDGA